MNREALEHLLDKLATGWRGTAHHAPEELLHCWGSALGAAVRIEDATDDAVRFRTDLSQVSLAGMGDVPCLLVGGVGPAAAVALQWFWQAAAQEQLIPCVLCASDAAYVEAASLLPRGRILLLARKHIGGSAG